MSNTAVRRYLATALDGDKHRSAADWRVRQHLAGAAVPRRPFVCAVDHERVQRRAILLPPWKLVEERRGDEVDGVVEHPREAVDAPGARPKLVAELLEAAAVVDGVTAFPDGRPALGRRRTR